MRERKGGRGEEGLRAFLFSLADRTTNTDAEKEGCLQPFFVRPK